MRIRPVTLEDIDTLSHWQSKEWNHDRPFERHHRPQDYAKKLAAHIAHPDTLPLTWVIDLKGELCGCVSLNQYQRVESGMTQVWLCNLYVSEKHRGQGWAQSLIHTALKQAKNMGFNQVKLFTHNQSEYYQRLGWQRQNDTRVAGKDCQILAISV